MGSKSKITFIQILKNKQASEKQERSTDLMVETNDRMSLY